MKRILLAVVQAVGIGMFTLVPSQRWWPSARRAYVLVPGVAVAAGGVLLVTGRAQEAGLEDAADSVDLGPTVERVRSLPMPARVLIPVAVGLAVSTSQALSLRIDAGAEHWLARRGLGHPRRWMAAAAAGLYLGLELSDANDPDPSNGAGSA